ncbi:uncharacterized protein LOC119552805 [Drosophila subpulchrella]|uniref:uncharacterized protein LOC119552805 n=1 Tax=Drosophila subpulchrella TaxID=1486046 RepID=UPI0018A1639F|nr:uncharacterized protein LOC119552805 [Drosophila subpulchrella]
MPDNLNAILVKCPKNALNKSCETQLIVNIHMNPSFDLDNTEKFWVVDQVYDPSKGTISKIISPYLIVLSRGEPVVMYPLQFLKSINHNIVSKRPLKKGSEVSDLGGSGSCTTNEDHLETNIKGHEIGNASRLKRNKFTDYTKGRSILSNFFGKEKQSKPPPFWQSGNKINDQYQNDISSLGLVQVMDTTVKKDHLEAPTELFHINKDILNYNFNGQGNTFKSRHNYDIKPKFDERPRNNKIESKPKEYLENINTLDDSDIRFLNEELKNIEQQHIEGKLHKKYTQFENPEDETVPDILLYDQIAHETRRKLNHEKFQNDYILPRKSSTDMNDFSYREDYKNNKFNSPSNSLSDGNDLSHEGNNNNISPKNKYETNNFKTPVKSQPNINDFPLETENEKYSLKSVSSGLSNEKKFSESKKQNFNFKPIPDVNEYPNEREYNNKYFKGSSQELSIDHDMPQDARKELYNLRTPADGASKVTDFTHEIKNENNFFKTSDYSLYDNNYLNFKPDKSYNYDNSPPIANDFGSDKENLNFNAPMKSLYSNNEFSQDKNNEFSNLPVNDIDDFSWTQQNIGDDSLDFIINHHMKQRLPSDRMDLNSEYFMPDSQKYSNFGPKPYKAINPYLTYPKNNFYRSLPNSRSRSFKRMKRSNLQVEDIEKSDGSQLDQKYGTDTKDLNSIKIFNLKNIDDNSEIPCDTCGGKNKKKDEKPRSRYCSVSDESKSAGSKIEDIDSKLNDAVPCDTCGGKNKKPDGKPLPGGLPLEINSIKAENEEQRLPDYMIPCESCKKSNKCTEGNLGSASCGCITNPSVCSCESSKLSRALNESAKDLTYSVFNMKNPVPFLATTIRVFRRRHNTWWRVVPIVTLDSVSGIFANKDLSAVLSSHVDLIGLEKSIGFSNRKLIIPKSNDNGYAKKRHANTLKELRSNIGNSVLVDTSSKDISIREIENFINVNMEKAAKKGGLSTRSIDGLGYFPVSMNALENCPHKDKHLCLNIREEKVPEFSIKVKIPFRENALVMRNKHLVKISRIITDATTKDALQVSIDVINKGLEAQEFSVYVCNCEVSSSASLATSARRLLQPDIGQTVTFLMPLIVNPRKNKKFSCDVVVKANVFKDNEESDDEIQKLDDPKVGVVAKRSMDVKCHARCFCVWRCRCHCIGKLETFINYNACERLDPKSEKEAGLIYNCPPGSEKNDVCIKDITSERNEEITCDLTCKIIAITLLVLTLLFLLGVLKAILGIFIQSIGRCGFDTVQPGRNYDCTSSIRIFLVNCFFFIIFPFACWCKFFRPKEKDLRDASYDWDCTSESGDSPDCSCDKKESSSSCRLHGGQDKTLHNNLVLAFAPLHENGLFKDEKSDDEQSHLFILEVLEESKHSLTKMMSQAPESAHNIRQSMESDADAIAADELVESLKNSQVAYRTMNSPVGGVIDIPENHQYCIKGFFLPIANSTYEFMSYIPLSQFVGISEENEVRRLPKPQYIHSNEFSKIYADKMEVHKSADLSVVPPLNVPCINIDHCTQLENSFVKLATQQEQIKANQS